MPMTLWFRLVCDLRRRGQGRRESGAFLLGVRSPGGDVVKVYIPYDELDPHALDTGVVVITGAGFAALWARCREFDLDVLGDVHTHPGRAFQSETDRTNPMISERGHMALILPRYAASWGFFFSGVGIYEYAGRYQWNDWSGPRRRARVRFSWS